MAQITAPPVTASHAPKGFLQSRRGWALAVAVWVLVGVLVAVVFWALPRAASSRRLAEQTSSLRVSLSQASAALDLAKAELASLQVKLDGSTAGHHGVESLVSAFRTRDFHRVRLGVGRPPGRVETHPDWLLEPVPKRQQADVERLVSDGADAVMTLVREGLAAAQERFNRRGPD